MWIDGFGRADGGKAIDVTFTEQIAPLHDLFNKLFERDRLPASRAARADPLQRPRNSEWAGHVLEHGSAASARR